MSILQQLLGKVKGVTAVSMPQEEQLNIPHPETQIHPSPNIPILRQPIQYSLDIILKSIPLSKEFSKVTSDLSTLTTQENLQISDVTAFTLSLSQEIDLQKLNLSRKEALLQEQKDVLAALDYLQDFSSRARALGSPLEKNTHPTYEQFPTCLHMVRMEACKNFLQEWKDGSQMLKTSPTLHGQLLALDNALAPVQQSLDALLQRISNFIIQGDTLKTEISQFSQALAKIKSMGKAGIDQYYASLSEVQKSLNEKRELYLEEEVKLNAFIRVILLSMEEAFGVFAPLVPEILSALDESMDQIKTINATLLTEDVTTSTIKHLATELEKLELLKDKINDSQSLHHYFS